MLIEIYKGVQITHNSAKDEFHTDIVVNKKLNGKKDYIKHSRLQAVRDEVDKYLNTAAKKPILKKGWIKGRHEDSWKSVDIICYNSISGEVIIKDENKQREIKLPGQYSDDRIVISCKENDAIIANLNKKSAEIERIKKEVSCSGGKLIPLKAEHFIQ